jgi:O-antigen/teichoic acid export membrane protein
VRHASGFAASARKLSIRGHFIKLLRGIKRIASVFRLKAHDTSTVGGRSKERLRRAGLTTFSTGWAKAIAQIIALVTVPLTFNYLGPERYGLWMVLGSIIAAMGVADLGIGNGLLNAISDAYGKDDHRLARECVTSAFMLMLGIAIFLTLLGMVAYPFIPWMRLFNVTSSAMAAEGSRALVILFFWFVVNIPLGVIGRAQAGLQKGYLPQLIGSFGSVLTLLALLLVIRSHGSLAWLVFASTVGSILGIIINAFVLFREHPWLMPTLSSYSAVTAKRLLKLGLMFFVLQCAVAISFTSDNIVITQILGAAAVAAYAVPQKLFNFLQSVVGLAIYPLWPAYGEAIARGDVAWVRRVFLGSLWLVLGITVPLSAAMVLACPWILRVFFGKSLHASTALLVVLAVWVVIYAIGVVTSILLNGAGVLREQIVVVIISSISNLLLSVFLTRRFGVMGV